MIKEDRDTIPLYVDLDGTFFKTDSLFETFFHAIKKKPSVILLSIYWLIIGRANLKYKLAQIAMLNIETLPLNLQFYDFLISEKPKRKIILATAGSELIAKDILKKFDLFSGYIASDVKTNMKGKEKLKKIRGLSKDFAYAGNSVDDYCLFRNAQEKYLVNPSRRVKKFTEKEPVDRIFDEKVIGATAWINQLRFFQLVKNILILVPLFVSGNYRNTELLTLSVFAFISFSLLASSTYIFNDLLDLESDRNHPRKKFRPLASGQIGIVNSIIVSIILAIFSFILSMKISLFFTAVLIVYLIFTLSYSIVLKRHIGLDVITLASLYTIRIIAGAIAIKAIVSFWLFSFSMFIFFSLAIVKRCSELRTIQKEGHVKVKGRGYNTTDYSVLMSIGTSSAMLSILTFCFYSNNKALSDQYQKPEILWLIVPALGYWLVRVWLKTNRGEMHDDPIVFSLKDKGSISIIIFIVAITLFAQIL